MASISRYAGRYELRRAPSDVSDEGSRDIVVIGAGAAGIAAARSLRGAGRDVTILEARDRVGGRVWTTYDLAPFPVELGAEYVHGEHVVTWAWLRELGLDSAEDGRDKAWWAFADGELLDPQGFAALMPSHPFDDLSDAASAWGPASATMETALRVWAQRNRARQLDSAWGLWNSAACADWGTDLDQLGSDALLEATYAGDGETNFRIMSGYGSLFERAAALLDVRLSTPVTAVEWGVSGAIVHSGSLAFACEHVVITLPLGVVAGQIDHLRTGRGEIKHHQIAAGPKHRAIGRVSDRLDISLGECDRKIAFDNHGISGSLTTASPATAGGKKSGQDPDQQPGYFY